jgi:hypothetical protein
VAAKEVDTYFARPQARAIEPEQVRFAELLAAGLATDIAEQPPAGELVRVIVRWLTTAIRSTSPRTHSGARRSMRPIRRTRGIPLEQRGYLPRI